MEEIKVGVVGLGSVGVSHARKIYDGRVAGMRLTAVCVHSEAKKENAENMFPGVRVFANVEEMYDSGLIDAVIIATPHYDHPPMAISAFRRGLHVLTEKPAGVYTLQVREMNEAARRSGKVFGIVYNQRTNPMYRKLRQMIANGELGHIKRITWIITDWYRSQAYHDATAWRSTWKGDGGGMLVDQNPHQLDLWQWMFGMPDRIRAEVSFGKYYKIEVEDDCMIYFEYDNGTTGEYIASTGEAPGTNRLEVSCDMGKIVIEDGSMLFYKNSISEREFNRINTKPLGHPEYQKIDITPEGGKGTQHLGILQNFADSIRNGAELIARGEEGILETTISNAAHLSAWTGEIVNTRDFPDERFLALLQEKIKASEEKGRIS